MKSSKRLVWFLLTLTAGLMIFSACKPQAAPKSTAVSPQKAGTKTSIPLLSSTATLAPKPAETVVEAPPTPEVKEPEKAVSANLLLDPALAQDADSLTISRMLYSGLFRLDASGQPEPDLAESWVISDDGLDYIFKLRADAVFSNGTAITPDIVKANFNRWFDPNYELRGKGSYQAWERTFLGFLGEKDDQKRAKSTVDGIEKVDQLTVLLHLNRPVPELLHDLADPAFAILSPEGLQAGDYGTRGSQITASGPYMLGAWTASELKLIPNPQYWGSAAEKELAFQLK